MKTVKFCALATAQRIPTFISNGEEVIAVADGVVTSLKDGIPENDPSKTTTAVLINLETVAGNNVVLEVGHAPLCAVCASATGQLKVKSGERVKRGQVLGKIGNSGNAVGPHLHFHITNSPALFEGEGLPYVIKSFEVWGNETPEEFKKGERKPRTAVQAVRHELEFPSDSAILSFP